MSNPDTQHMIDLVERQAGYRVTVDVISGIYEHAQMISARPGAPAHVIRVNVDHRQHADYIVAAQCAMLLVMWSDPAKVPGMAFEKSKCDYSADKWARTKPLAVLPVLPADNAAAMAKYYVEGLLKQLHSEPLEIRVRLACGRLSHRLRRLNVTPESAGYGLAPAILAELRFNLKTGMNLNRRAQRPQKERVPDLGGFLQRVNGFQGRLPRKSLTSCSL